MHDAAPPPPGSARPAPRHCARCAPGSCSPAAAPHAGRPPGTTAADQPAALARDQRSAARRARSPARSRSFPARPRRSPAAARPAAPRRPGGSDMPALYHAAAPAPERRLARLDRRFRGRHVGAPGPNNAMVTAWSKLGFTTDYRHIAERGRGSRRWCCAVGSAPVKLTQLPGFRRRLRWLGRIVYALARRRNCARRSDADRDVRPTRSEGGRSAFRQAALFQWVNPKAWVAAVGAVVTYTSGGTALVGASGVLAIISLAISPPILLGWTLVGSRRCRG